MSNRVPTAFYERVLHPGAQLALFLAFAVVFYRLFPQFLIQNHDAQNVYFTLSKGLQWRASLLEIYAYSPFSGLGSNFWPLFIPAIPYLAAFEVASDPTARLYLLQIGAASTLFAAALFFFSSARLERGVAIASSWTTFALVMLYALAYVSAPENLMVMVWSLVAIGALMRLRGAERADLGWAGLFQIAFAGFVLAVPAWHVIALPVFASCAFALVLFAEQRAQRRWRIACLALAILLQLAIGSYQALRYTLADTARVMLPEQFALVPHYLPISGHLLNNQPIDMLVGTLFVIGLGWLRPGDFASGTGRPLHAATILAYAVLVITGLVFYYTSGPWPLPWPKYPLMFAYPLTALFAVSGARALLMAPWDAGRVRSAVALLGIYLTWHAVNDFGELTVSMAFVCLVLVAGTAGARLINRPAGIAVLCAALLFSALKFANDSFGGGADRRFDGVARMGIGRTPVTDFLAERVAIAPGKPFRGRVDDLYSRPADSRELIDTIISHWSGNWMRYGNGHKLFNWTAMDIPIAGEYNQYTRPPYFLLYTRLLNEPDDRQVFNYLSATRPNAAIWRLIGVRFIVTDRAELSLPGASEVFRWQTFRVLELARPNLGNYSPTNLRRARTAAEALQALSDTAFDAETDVLVDNASEWPVLSRATESRIVLERGALRITATSEAASLIVLPMQFSHCFALEDAPGARIVRADLALTGILFTKHVDATLHYRRWPFAGLECQRQDRDDSSRLVAAG